MKNLFPTLNISNGTTNEFIVNELENTQRNNIKKLLTILFINNFASSILQKCTTLPILIFLLFDFWIRHSTELLEDFDSTLIAQSS